MARIRKPLMTQFDTLHDLFVNIQRAIDSSSLAAAIQYEQHMLELIRTVPGYPPPEITQVASIQNTEDFILLTEALLKCHNSLITARRELLLVGVHNIEKGDQKEPL